jgi:Protein of unknown function (DUF1214)
MPASEQQQQAARTWKLFCERLGDAGEQLLREDFPVQDLDVAEGLRYLTHLLFASIQRNLVGADPSRPQLYLLCDERIKSGGDNPDNRYYVASVSNAYEYLLTADLRGCAYYSIIALDRKEMTSGLSAEEREERAAATRLDSDTLLIDADGSVRVSIGTLPGNAPNHLRIDERTNLIIVRCTIEDRSAPAVSIGLQRVDANGPGASLTLQGLSASLASIAEHLIDTASFFGDWTSGFQEHLNQLPLGDQAYIRSTGGDPNILYYLSAWRVGTEEALVIRIAELPPCRAWNFQLCNVWMESLDYTRSRVHLNGTNVQRAPDGSITLVIAASDPGHPNWLDTTGHTSGTMCMRLTGAARPVVARTSLMSLAAARKLEADSA